jgi:ubiquinone/menaquinone biosynthesis C-methylase UbiE
MGERGDMSNGYEEHARTFMRARNPRIGPDVVREWCRTLKPGSSILELACGSGVPITQVLIEEGLQVWAIDASQTLLETLRERYPQVQTEWAAAEDSEFFGRTFDAVLAWGLMFLLAEEAQTVVIEKAARVLKPDGQFVFTAPGEPVQWKDSITERDSISLGAGRYVELLEGEGLSVEHGKMDAGENYYFFATRR